MGKVRSREEETQVKRMASLVAPDGFGVRTSLLLCLLLGVLSWSQRGGGCYRASKRVRESAFPNYQAEPLQSLPGEDLQLPGAWEG